MGEGNLLNDHEISKLARVYGEPAYRKLTIDADRYLYASRHARSQTRRGEVVMLIDRPNDSILLHRKGWYEKDVYRIPTGGIEKGEEIIGALHRELLEETGFHDGKQEFLGILDCRIVFQSQATRFLSYFFYLWDLNGSLRLPESKEDISDFRDIPVKDLPKLSDHLRQVSPPRAAWGEWRALAHDFAYQLLIER